ncbi:M23 family metallopeptidase [Promicromonospora sp. NPDC050262]|uniref:murein hydrolase activator EnvC family protein n=1 Tax=Promicromonospora sp. NPDC050262 TaxID=3155036 RepID=UPI0033D18E85
MTTPRAPHRAAHRRTTAALLSMLLAVALAALVPPPPAAALRSGPDIAVRVGLDHRLAPGASDRGAADPRTGYVPPVAGVDPPSGVERLFDPPAEKWGAGHRGVDLTAPPGAQVVSPGPGVVTFAGQVARRGVVVVTHPDGLRSSLEPVAASVPVGTAVAAGTAIGVVEGSQGTDEPGATPNHCAPRSCVHWGVRRGERYIDPLSLLDRPPIVLLPER